MQFSLLSGNYYVSQFKIRCQLEKALHFKVHIYFVLFNFERHSWNRVGNISIFVLWRDHEKNENSQKVLTYPEIVPLSALIACNAMNWLGGDALSFSHRFHHWLMLYTLGQYIVNVQSSTTGNGFLTIFIFGIWYSLLKETKFFESQKWILRKILNSSIFFKIFIHEKRNIPTSVPESEWMLIF